MSACSRYESCSSMKCPLDSEIDTKMVYDPDLDGGVQGFYMRRGKASRREYLEAMPDDLKARLL